MPKKDEVKGVTASRKRPIVIHKETNPNRQFMTKKEALADNARLKAAQEAADAARRKVLAGEPEAPKADLGQAGDSDLTVARKRLAEIEAKIQKKSTPALEKQKAKLEKEIEKLEDEAGE